MVLLHEAIHVLLTYLKGGCIKQHGYNMLLGL